MSDLDPLLEIVEIAEPISVDVLNQFFRDCLPNPSQFTQSPSLHERWKIA